MDGDGYTRSKDSRLTSLNESPNQHGDENQPPDHHLSSPNNRMLAAAPSFTQVAQAVSATSARQARTGVFGSPCPSRLVTSGLRQVKRSAASQCQANRSPGSRAYSSDRSTPARWLGIRPEDRNDLKCLPLPPEPQRSHCFPSRPVCPRPERQPAFFRELSSRPQRTADSRSPTPFLVRQTSRSRDPAPA